MIMANQEGKFVWYELMTDHPEAAKTFYKSVNGWTTQDIDGAGGKYTILNAGGVGIGGLMQMPEEARKNGARPAWVGYVHVDDVDAKAEEVKKAGGAVHRGADDIPGVGRFAVV